MSWSYSKSGVDRQLGNEASDILYRAAKLTWANRTGRLGEVFEPFQDFSGFRAINVGGLPFDALMNIGFDGIGTKVELAERLKDHRTVAYDLFAMVCDDAVVRGGEPVVIGSILDVNSLGGAKDSHIDLIGQLAEGYVNAAKAARVAVVNGEVAELGARIRGSGSFNYNWGAGVVWFARRSRILTGREVRRGDSIVALEEEGFRSNGMSLLRKTMQDAYGDDWHEQKLDGRKIGELALQPSRIYTAAVVDMFGGFDQEPLAEVHGVAHITGGGVPEKLGRILRFSGLGAEIDNPMKPCKLMTHCQELGDIPDREVYLTWNMGQGMLIVTPSPEAVEKVAATHSIKSRVVGKITSNPYIAIGNVGAFSQTDEELVFPLRV